MNIFRWCIPAILALFLGAGLPVLAQYIRTKIHATPNIPTTDELRRLGLNLRWQTKVPMDGLKDGLLAVLVDRKDILILTRSGMVARYDAESGRAHWKARVGKTYSAVPTLAANARSVFTVTNAEVFSLDRQRGDTEWRMKLLSGLAAAPATGELEIETFGGTKVEDLLIIPGADSRLTAFMLPPPDEELLDLPADERKRMRFPREAWTAFTDLDLAFQPLHTPASIFAIGPSGEGRGYLTATGGDLFRFFTVGKVRVRPGQFGRMTYIGSNDGNVYAVDTIAGKQVWRHTAGSAVIRTPSALDTDVFVTSDIEGMARIDSLTGESQWKVPLRGRVSSTNPDAYQFLAASPRFVYAKDRSNYFLVIDRKRGTTLSRAAWNDFHVPVTNIITDRIYLASHDGTIVCLHDRNQIKPIRYQKVLEDAQEPILRRLNEPVTITAGKRAPMKDLLKDLGERYRFEVEYDMEALKKAKLGDVLDKPLAMSMVADISLRELLKRLLFQVKVDFTVSDGKLLIIPPAGKPPAGDDDGGKNPPKDD